MNARTTRSVVVAVCAALGQHGCDQGPVARAEKACDAKILELDTRLRARIEGAKTALNAVKWDATILKWKTEEHDYAVFNPASSGYARIDTTSGTFLVVVTDFKPYANGYRLGLKVGNPSAARYSDAKLKLKWGKPWDAKIQPSSEEWEKSLHQAETAIRELRPATWNRASVVLSPAVAEDTGYVQISMVTDQVILANP